MLEPMPLKPGLTDQHYSQLFFVVGHVSIKMLTYVEYLEAELKTALIESFKKKKEKVSQDEDSNEEEKNQEDDLAQITGGKEAEVDEYV